MKIGIFGGTFDPVHKGHLSLASQLIKKCVVERILFMVSANPPHKNGVNVSAQKRFEMVCLALEGQTALQACDMELKRKGNSYTVDTMRQVQALYPKDSIYFITGADMFIDIPNWRAPDQLFEEQKFIVADRGRAFEDEIYNDKKNAILSKYKPDVQFVQIETPDISSSLLRECIEKYKDYLPEKVYAYIKRNGLYG